MRITLPVFSLPSLGRTSEGRKTYYRIFKRYMLDFSQKTEKHKAEIRSKKAADEPSDLLRSRTLTSVHSVN